MAKVLYCKPFGASKVSGMLESYKGFPIQVCTISNLAQFRQEMKNGSFDIFISETTDPFLGSIKPEGGFAGYACIQEIIAKDIQLPYIAIGYDSISIATTLVDHGIVLNGENYFQSPAMFQDVIQKLTQVVLKRSFPWLVTC